MRLACGLARTLAGSCGPLLLLGCSAEWYRQSADDEVYTILQSKRNQVVVVEERRASPFSATQELVRLDTVGETRPVEALRLTPAPEPAEIEVDIQTILESADEVESDEPGEGEPAAVPDDADPATSGPSDLATPSAPESSDPARSAPETTAPSAPSTSDPGPPESAPAAPATEERQDESAEGEEPGDAGDAASAPPRPVEGTQADDEERAAEEEGEEEAAASEKGEDAVDTGYDVPMLPARVLSLNDALQLAFANNRDYQNQKEAVYLAALNLTLARFTFAPRFFGVITGDYDVDADGAESGRVTSNFGVTKLFASGARLSLSLFNNFFQFFTGDRRAVANTIIQGSLTQPLLRGFGKDIVLEPLTQSERNVIYQVRSFERFRKTFAVEVISEYYRILQNIDTVHNQYSNWQARVDNRARSESLAEAERIPQFEVDQARQSELQAHDSWVAAVTRYENSLDRFKITLGIDVEAEIALDSDELLRLGEDSIRPLEISVSDAMGIALEHRLDLKTAKDRVEDAVRRVKVSADALRAQLDVTASAALPSGDGRGPPSAQTPLTFNTGNFEYGVGFDLDLPLDRKAERNSYVRALIDYEREKREYSLFEDNIELLVRDEYRILEREIASFAIQKSSVELGEQRVASTSTLRDAGRATTRDVLDSQDALNAALNDLTEAFVNYTIARLAFFRDTGTLQVTLRNEVMEPDILALIPGEDRGGGEDSVDSETSNGGGD